MTEIRDELVLNAAPEKVWEVMSDLGGVQNYHPFVQKSYYTTDHTQGEDAARICEFDNGMVLQETAVAWADQRGYTLTIDILKGAKPPVNDLSGELFYEQIDECTTKVVMVVRYQPRFGVFGKIMDRFMIRPQYAKMLPAVLAGLERHLLTGEMIDRSVLGDLRVSATAV